MIPEDDRARVERWVQTENDKVPDEHKDKLRIELDVGDRTLTIVECRPPWNPDVGTNWTRSPVARLRYTQGRNEWALYWVDHKSHFHEYDRVPSTPYVSHLLAEIDRDPTASCWGS